MSETQKHIPESSIQPTEQTLMTETISPITKESFIKRRIADIRNFYENLTPKQRDVLQVGAMALSTAIIPSISLIEGGSQQAHGSEMFLQAEAMAGLVGLQTAAVVKGVRALRNR